MSNCINHNANFYFFLSSLNYHCCQYCSCSEYFSSNLTFDIVNKSRKTKQTNKQKLLFYISYCVLINAVRYSGCFCNSADTCILISKVEAFF